MKRRQRVENHCRLLVYKETREKLRSIAYWRNEDMITVVQKLIDKAYARERRNAPSSR